MQVPHSDLCGSAADPSLQIRQNSEHGERHRPGVQMGTTVILTTKILTRRAPRSATLLRSCLLIRSKIITTNLVCSIQRPRKSYCRGLTDGTRASAKIESGKDVSHRLG